MFVEKKALLVTSGFCGGTVWIVCAALYFVYCLQFFMPQSLGQIVEYLSLSFHLDNLARGVLDTRDILYYLSVTFGALFLAVQSMNRQHA